MKDEALTLIAKPRLHTYRGSRYVEQVELVSPEQPDYPLALIHVETFHKEMRIAYGRLLAGVSVTLEITADIEVDNCKDCGIIVAVADLERGLCSDCLAVERVGRHT